MTTSHSLWRNLSENQQHHRGRQGGDSYTGGAEQLQRQGGEQGGDGNVHNVVAHQHRVQKLLLAVQQPSHTDGSPVLL